ncbi:MAG: CGNR zinc finger domain-containing protein [Pseudomonadota bacterium]
MMTLERSTAEPRAYFSSIGRLRMLAGDPALDFANTLHWRGGIQVDFLPDYQSLIEWSAPAGLLSEDEMRMLVGIAPTNPNDAEATHSAAIALRCAWRDTLSERTGGRPMLSQRRGSDSELQPLLASALADPRLLISASPRSGEHHAHVLFLPVARVALAIASLELIPGDRQLGRCEGDPCGGFFLNTSRSKPRRWCSMDSCGNRAKVRGFRSRMVAEEVTFPFQRPG